MTERPLRVNYLLEDTALFGGVRVPLHHANLLHRHGYEVRVISRGSRPDWYEIEAPFIEVSHFTADNIPEADLNIATYWTTIGPTVSLPVGVAVHYCQGFEASYTHNQDEHPLILEAYSLPLPAFAVSPHIAELVRNRFGRPVRIVPPALESGWRPRLRFGPKHPPRVLVLHPFEIDWKGVETAIAAVELLCREGFEVRLVRISQWPLTDAERDLTRPDEFHCRLTHRDVARIMSGCDLLIAPSWEQEGFGLPVIEAMACEVPVIGSDSGEIPHVINEAGLIFPESRADRLAEQLTRLQTDPGHAAKMGKQGRQRVLARFSTEQIARQTFELYQRMQGAKQA